MYDEHFTCETVSPALEVLKGSLQTHPYSIAGEFPHVAKQISKKLEFKNFKRL